MSSTSHFESTTDLHSAVRSDSLRLRRMGFEPIRSRASFSRLLPVGLPPQFRSSEFSGDSDDGGARDGWRGIRTLSILILSQAPLPIGLSSRAETISRRARSAEPPRAVRNGASRDAPYEAIQPRGDDWPGWELNPHCRCSEHRASCQLGYLARRSPRERTGRLRPHAAVDFFCCFRGAGAIPEMEKASAAGMTAETSRISR